VSAAFNHLQRTQLDSSLLAVAVQEAREAPEHRFSFSNGPGPAANDVGPLTKYGIIFDQNGRVLSATNPFDQHPPSLHSLKHADGQAFDLWFEHSHLRGVFVPIPHEPGKVLFLATSRDDLDGDEAFLHRAMLVAFLVALIWVGAIAYWMGGRLTVAHREIAGVVRRVTAGDLSARVANHDGDPELVRLGREINEMVARLDQLLKSQERFIANAAHELRTPLATLYGELQQARRRPRDAAYYERRIDAALDSARDLTVLAEDLLTLVRTRALAGDECRGISLADGLTDALALVEPLARARNVLVRKEGDWTAAVPDRKGDTARLLRNVLENAIRHAPTGSEVELVATAHERGVEVSVSDRGPGVAEGEREAIFEPFFRGARAALSGGSGLGLGIAREIARAHGGDVTLRRQPSGDGACFVIRFAEPPAPDLAGRSQPVEVR
jgi:two-component system heavy metal sensor histidine kinase CusS